MSTGTVHVVVQRCLRARLLVDEASDRWVDIGRGLVFYVSFSKDVTKGDVSKHLRQVAKSLLTAPLSSSDKWAADHSDAESVVSLCQKGEAQGLLVVPQASLVCKLEPGDKYLKYHQQCGRDDATQVYTDFVESLRIVARELVTGATRKAKSDQSEFKALEAKRAAAALIPPSELFKHGEYDGLYSKYDERGVPTHDAEGAEVAKSAAKKLDKIFAAQVKKYEKALAAGETAAAPALAISTDESTTASSDTPVAEDLPVPEGMVLPDLHHGTFGGRQGFELTSAGPLTHSFVF